MNWILVAFVFKLAANGDFDSPKMLYRGFPTEEACNFAGEHFRDKFILPVSTKSVSICIDKAAFDTVDWQILETPKSATSAAATHASPLRGASSLKPPVGGVISKYLE